MLENEASEANQAQHNREDRQSSLLYSRHPWPPCRWSGFF
jgi:hypothetical protein